MDILLVTVISQLEQTLTPFVHAWMLCTKFG